MVFVFVFWIFFSNFLFFFAVLHCPFIGLSLSAMRSSFEIWSLFWFTAVLNWYHSSISLFAYIFLFLLSVVFVKNVGQQSPFFQKKKSGQFCRQYLDKYGLLFANLCSFLLSTILRIRLIWIELPSFSATIASSSQTRLFCHCIDKGRVLVKLSSTILSVGIYNRTIIFITFNQYPHPYLLF